MNKFEDAGIQEINEIMEQSWRAFREYRKLSLKQRAGFMHRIADEIEALGEDLIQTAMEETHLPATRLRSERARTVFQLNSYAAAAEDGAWLEARIHTANPSKNPPGPDLRKMLVPLGPVVVFGASNFPFAYSTAGGDTACALAAGCPVIVKAHPAHAATSALVAQAIFKAAEKMHMPKGVFAHVHGAGIETGKQLVLHPRTAAVGFTGSFAGGKSLFDLAAARKIPIPVFAEMGSINPVFLLPEKLEASSQEVATLYAGSITLGAGQFCTNPGLIIGIESEGLRQFIQYLGQAIRQVAPAPMLHAGIAKAFDQKRAEALSQQQVDTIAVADAGAKENESMPTLASAPAEAFLKNPVLHQEVFGPYSIVIRCRDMQEMITVARHLEGQLTATLMATENDIRQQEELVETVQDICGRFILNGVPTGVEVCLAMQHGGPFPAATDSRFTSVGADGIKRFVRPVAYQDWNDALLPDALKNGNPLGIWRTVDNRLTKEAL